MKRSDGGRIDSRHEAAVTALLRYGFSILVVALSNWLRVQLDPYFHTTFLFGTFAIVITAQFAGTGPALLALALSILSIDYFVFAPEESFAPLGPGHWVGIGFFSFIGVAIAVLAESQRRSYRRAEDAAAQANLRRQELEREVAERKRAERSLKESESRLKQITEIMPQLVWTARPDGTIDYRNKRWLDYSGLEGQELQAGGWRIILHPDDVEPTLTAWDAATRAGAEYHVEHRLRAADGHYEWFLTRAQPSRGEDGTIEKWFGTSTGIDDLKRAQDALYESRERLRIAQRAARAGTWDWDIVQDQVTLSPEYSELCGMSVGPCPFQAWLTSVHEEDREPLAEHIKDVLRRRADPQFQFRARRPDGSVCWILAHGKTLCNSDGDPIRVIGIALDVTAAKQAEAHLLRLLDEAQQHKQDLQEKQEQLIQAAKLATVGELATGVAHELNNPLNNIGLFVGNLIDSLRASPADPDLVISVLQEIQGQVGRAAKIISQLRTFGRRASYDREPLAINGVVRSAVSLLEAQLQLAGIRVVLHFDEADCVVEGNHLKLEQVLINLLANARDAVKSAPEKVIAVTVTSEGKHVKIRVQDTGKGIAPEIQGRIFDPFFTTKPVGEGTGLGLSISYAIIKDHQGTIDVATSEAGSSFTISLPVLKADLRGRARQDA
ncbi:PAS domain-containing protein [Candidatus Nitrospira bockiana]